ncbi:UNVERIFIED_CONTAM: hypothetical protein HHA_254530 [Hammondia hammondi]|eukprot:XP_008885075.1 hypothetical protein HHA_254530 [Hammondia hammondi]
MRETLSSSLRYMPHNRVRPSSSLRWAPRSVSLFSPCPRLSNISSPSPQSLSIALSSSSSSSSSSSFPSSNFLSSSSSSSSVSSSLSSSPLSLLASHSPRSGPAAIRFPSPSPRSLHCWPERSAKPPRFPRSAIGVSRHFGSSPAASAAPFEDFDFTFCPPTRRRWRPPRRPRSASPACADLRDGEASARVSSSVFSESESVHSVREQERRLTNPEEDEEVEEIARELPYGYATLDQLQGRWVRLALKNVLVRTRRRRAKSFSSSSWSACDADDLRQRGDRDDPALTLLSDVSVLDKLPVWWTGSREEAPTAAGSEAESEDVCGASPVENTTWKGEVKTARKTENTSDEDGGETSDGWQSEPRGERDMENASDARPWAGVYVHPKCVRTLEKLERLLPRMAAHDVCLCLRYLADAELLALPVSLGCMYTLRQKAEELSAREIGVVCGILSNSFFRHVSARLAREARLSFGEARARKTHLQSPQSVPSGTSESRDTRESATRRPCPATPKGVARGFKETAKLGEQAETEREAAGEKRRLGGREDEEDVKRQGVLGKRWTAERDSENARRRQLLEALLGEKELTLRKLKQVVRAKCHDLHHADDVCTVLWTFHGHGLLSPSLLSAVRRLLLERLRERPDTIPATASVVPSSASSSSSLSPSSASSGFLQSLLPRHVASLLALFLRTGALDRELFRALWGACLSEIPSSSFSTNLPASHHSSSDGLLRRAPLLADCEAGTAREDAQTRKARAVGLWLASRLREKDLTRFTEGLLSVTSPLGGGSGVGSAREEETKEETRWKEEERVLAKALQLAAARKHLLLSGSTLSTLLFGFAALSSQLPGVCVHPDLAFRASTRFAWKPAEFPLAAQAQFLCALPALSSSLPPDPLLVSALASSLTQALGSSVSSSSPGLLPLLSLSWVAVAALLSLFQRSSAAHAVAAAANRERRRHFLDILRHLPSSASSSGSSSSSSSLVSLRSSPSSPFIFRTALAAASSSFALASSPPGSSAHSASVGAAAEATLETGRRPTCVEDASGDPAAHSRAGCGGSEGSATLPSVSLVSAEASPSVDVMEFSSLQFLEPPPVPSSVLRLAEAEQHLLALRDTLEVATEALTVPAAAPVFSRKGLGPLEGRRPEPLRQGGCTPLFKEVDACSVLAQAVLWTQVAAAACGAQASAKLVRGALGSARDLLGAPESRGALAGSCRAAAVAVVGLQSPETQAAAGVRSRLLSLAALWQNVSALRCRDSGVIYPLVEAVDAVAEATGATAQSPPRPEVSPFARDTLATVSGGEHPLSTLFVDLLLSACELQSALLLAAEAETEVSRSALPQWRLLRPANQQPHAFLEASTAAPDAPPVLHTDAASLAFASASPPAPRARLANAQVYGHLLPCVMCEAARRFRDGVYIPPAWQLPLWLLARRFLLAPPFPALFASGERTESLGSLGSEGRRAKAVGLAQLAWSVHEWQDVRAFLKHLEWREAAASVDACIQSNW